jgi:coenzyme F420-0:L-glutamate ligase/coenzyme F420-1:gamma-L-glutamate ligase
VLAALTAPLSDRAAPVRVVRLASPAARRRYLEALEAAWRADPAAGGAQAAAVDRRLGRSRALLAEAPVLLVPCLAAGGADQGDRGAAAWIEVQLAAGGAVQTLLLALHALGLAGAWIASSLSCQQAAARALELPDGWLPLGSVVAGRPDPDDPPRAPGQPDPARLLSSR